MFMSCAIRVVWAASVVVIGMAGVDGAFGRDWIVAQQHPAATDDGPGDASRPFATITAAALVAGPNDRVVVRAGVYRERVAPVRSGEPNRPIVYTAAPDERVVIKAMDWWRPRWRAVEGSPGVVFGRFADDQFDLDRRYAAGWMIFLRVSTRTRAGSVRRAATASVLRSIPTAGSRQVNRVRATIRCVSASCSSTAGRCARWPGSSMFRRCRARGRWRRTQTVCMCISHRAWAIRLRRRSS
ncbi:MAG: hypothetical protein GVY24_00010 [Planctomycetes bacterium]|nr:hypothetical protein [Planctomycetota bacterium]